MSTPAEKLREAAKRSADVNTAVADKAAALRAARAQETPQAPNLAQPTQTGGKA